MQKYFVDAPILSSFPTNKEKLFFSFVYFVNPSSYDNIDRSRAQYCFERGGLGLTMDRDILSNETLCIVSVRDIAKDMVHLQSRSPNVIWLGRTPTYDWPVEFVLKGRIAGQFHVDVLKL